MSFQRAVHVIPAEVGAREGIYARRHNKHRLNMAVSESIDPMPSRYPMLG